jgi:UDP-galactopyranose mutase
MDGRKKYIAVAGAGFSGAVVARQLAERGYRIVLFEARSHLAGNCHTERDAATGVLLHCYGAHFFHTSREDVWAYVNRFGRFHSFPCRAMAVTDRGVYSLPINLLTINQFFGRVMSPVQARSFVEGLCDRSIAQPRTFEEQALKFVGPELYEVFFKSYTAKQWSIDPKKLPAAVLQRLPVRFSYDDNYFSDRFQGVPVGGYTEVVRRIIEHPNIELRMRTQFVADMAPEFVHVFYTGALDEFFGYCLGMLRYQTLDFVRIDDEGDYQGIAIMNYCSPSVPHVRSFEHKHLAPWEDHKRTVVYRQSSRPASILDPKFYPLRLSDDCALLTQYVELADETANVTFIGRLGTYRYLDMHVAIGEALDIAKAYLAHSGRGRFRSSIRERRVLQAGSHRSRPGALKLQCEQTAGRKV